MNAVFRVRLRPEAETDLQRLHSGLIDRGAAPSTARSYVNRILGYLNGFDVLPKRGGERNEIRQGLRVVGFERRVSLAFVVDDGALEIVVLRILCGGQQLELGGD